MCGRYASFAQGDDLAAAYARNGFIQDPLFGDGTDNWGPSWNIAPTHDVRIIVDRPVTAQAAETLVMASGERSPALAGLISQLAKSDPQESLIDDDLVRQVRRARWGLVPGWAKDPSVGAKMINARSETITEKPSFRRAFASRRCIIPADGYFEWTTLEGPPQHKIPNYITPYSSGMFAFAGIYEFWKPHTATDRQLTQWLVTASIITTDAEDELAQIHERRPIFLTPDTYDAWLSPHTSVDVAQDILRIPVLPTVQRVVSADVNRVANNGESLILPV
jgi:putative SOS response-associated peptidase YedK